MPDAPSLVQLLLVAAAALCVAGGVAASSVAGVERGIGRWAVWLPVAGLVLAVLAQAQHAATRGDWRPLQDNFDALLWLAVLTGGATLYLRWRATVPRIDLVAGPVVILLLVGAAVFGRARPHEYTNGLWLRTHLYSSYASPAFFALAACAGVLYLTLRRKLRRHATAPPDAGFGSLEKLERVNFSAVRVGFALLTVALISGVLRAAGGQTKMGEHWFLAPKVLLTAGAYLAYAVVLHSPINPSFRGKRTAVLSIAGFVLLLGTLVTVQFVAVRH